MISLLVCSSLSISAFLSSSLIDLSLGPSFRLSAELMLLRNSDGLISLFEPANGKLGGTNGKTLWRLTGVARIVLDVDCLSSSLRLTIVRSEQEEFNRRAAKRKRRNIFVSCEISEKV